MPTTPEKQNLVEYHLSDQAMGAVMMALQKSLLEQSDIVPVLKGFRLTPDDGSQLVVLNPPLVKLSHEDADILDAAAQGDAMEPETCHSDAGEGEYDDDDEPLL